MRRSKMILIFTLLLLSSNYSNGEEATSWWDTITNSFPIWYSSEEIPIDNDKEISDSVKLTEMFPTLKDQLNSSDENERNEAKAFVEKMNAEIKEKKRYSNVIWKGVRRIIDMGRVESNERRSNDKEVTGLMKIIQSIVDFFKWILGMSTDDKDKNKEKDDVKQKDDKSVKEKHHDVQPIEDYLDKDGKPKKYQEHELRKEVQHERPVDHELAHVGPIPLEHTPPESVPDAGKKVKNDQYNPSEPEFIAPTVHSHDDQSKKTSTARDDKDW